MARVACGKPLERGAPFGRVGDEVEFALFSSRGFPFRQSYCRKVKQGFGAFRHGRMTVAFEAEGRPGRDIDAEEGYDRRGQ